MTSQPEQITQSPADNNVPKEKKGWSLSIKLAAAKFIFDTVEFIPLVEGVKTIGYQAIFNGQRYESSALIHLCLNIWRVVTNRELTSRCRHLGPAELKIETAEPQSTNTHPVNTSKEPALV